MKKAELQERLRRAEKDLEYIQTFIYAIRNNNFDRRFVDELFKVDMNLDQRKASREIMYFITMNKHRWRNK